VKRQIIILAISKIVLEMRQEQMSINARKQVNSGASGTATANMHMAAYLQVQAAKRRIT